MRHHNNPLINFVLVFSLLAQTITPLLAPFNLSLTTTTAVAAETTSSPQRPALERAPASNFFADLNGDQRVDENDLSLLGEVWNCATGDPCYTADFDFNSDGLIDALDLATVGNEYDIEPPLITINSPAEDAVLTGESVTVSGTAVDAHLISELLVNGIPATLTPTSAGADFTAVISATDGVLPLHVSAVDALGQTSGSTRLVSIDREGPYITLNTPAPRQAVYTTRPTVDIAYTDLIATVDSATLAVTLTDESDTTTDITSQLTADADTAVGTLTFDLQEDETYTLTVSVADTNGLLGTYSAAFYVPLDANSLTPPILVDGAGFVSGYVFNSDTCGGTKQYDPINCTGIAGAQVTLEAIDPTALTLARQARLEHLEKDATLHGLPHQATADPVPFRTAVAGTIVTGPDGFFAFPVDSTGNYSVRVEKEGFTYGQRMTGIVLEKSTATTNIYLTPLDTAVTPCDSAGCQHTSADGQLQLDIPPGAIPVGETLDVRATEFDQVQFLPSGDLPPGTGETYAFNLSGASEITFTTPITVMLQNSRGFAPGTNISLGYWNQHLQVWEDAGDATVDDTGDWLVMQVTHFSNFDPNDPVTLARAELRGTNRTTQPAEDCATDCDSSQIEISSGGLRQAFPLPSVEILDAPETVTLQYDSQRASATAVIDLEIGLEALTAGGLGDVDLMQAELFIEGESTQQFSFSVEELTVDGEIGRFRYFWDGRDAQGRRMPPGVYFYAVQVKIPYEAEFFGTTNGRFGGPADPSQPLGITTTATIEETLFGSVLINQDTEGHYGQGWQVADVQRLYSKEDGSLLIDDGQGVLTQYLLPRVDLLVETPEVQTLGRDLASRDLLTETQTTAVTPTKLFTASQPTRYETNTTTTEEDTPVSTPNNSRLNTSITSDVLTDTVWTLAGSPYNVENDITIDASATLTVEAGVEVRIDNAHDIFVDGHLVTEGTAVNPVTITADSGLWGAIIVQNGGTAAFTHTNLSDGGQSTSSINGRDAGLVVISSTLTMSETTMLNMGNTSNIVDGCLYAHDSAVTLLNTVLNDCGSPTIAGASSNTTAALVLRGTNTAVQASNLVITNSHRFPLAIDAHLLDSIPPATYDKDIVRVFAGTLTDNTTLTTANGLSNYLYSDDLTIGAGTTLTLTAGVRWSAIDTTDAIFVNGNLSTRGTVADPVVFTSDEDSAGGEWGGLFVDGGTADLEFTSIRFAGRRNVDGFMSNLLVRDGHLRFVDSETLVAQDFGGSAQSAHLTVINSTAVIENSLISDNGLNGANPDYGLLIVDDNDTADVSLTNTTIAHRIRPIRLPFSQLPGLAASNTIVPGQTNARLELDGATLNEDLTMTALSGFGRYAFFDTLTVGTNSTLTLTAGVQLMAETQSDDVIVNGSLIAHGTAESPVIFTSLDNSGPGEWGGLLVDGGTADLEFTTIRFGGQLSVDANHRTALGVVNGGNLRFVRSALFQNGDTDPRDDSYLHVADSTAVVQNSLLSDDGLGAANPSHGIILQDTGNLSFTYENNALVHRSRQIGAPLAVLQQIAGNNSFNSDGNQRFIVTDNSISNDVTLDAIGNLAVYEFENDITFTGNVTVTAGTAVRFSNRRVFQMDGGTLTANGTVDAPILFDGFGGGANSWDGIQLQNGASAQLRFVTIADAFRGLDLHDSGADIQQSVLRDNSAGITLFGTPTAFLARLNDIEDNDQFGVFNDTGVEVDARLNFWGSPLGPEHPDNPTGNGDRVSADVLFTPFLSSSGQGADGTTAVNLSPHDTTALIFDETTDEFVRTYPDGRVVIFNSDGLHTTSRDSVGNEWRYTYNADNSLATIGYVANGRTQADWTWTFDYGDLQNRATVQRHLVPVADVTITDPAGRVTTLSLDKNGHLVALQEPGLSAPMAFAYGAEGNMTHKTSARGHTTTYEYDEHGRVTRSLLPPREIFDPATGQFSQAQEIHDFVPGDTQNTVNDLALGSPDAPNPPLGKTTEIASQQSINGRVYSHTTNEFGAQTGYIDPLNQQTRLERDERDRLVRRVTPLGHCTTFTYDAFDNVLTRTEMDEAACHGGVGLTRRITNTYDTRFNQLHTTTDFNGEMVTYVYDYERGLGEAGLLVEKRFPAVDDGTGNVVTPVESYSYNQFGQRTAVTDTLGIKTCYSYTSGDPSEAGTIFADSVTPVPGLLTQIREDCDGSLERTTTFRAFDAAGNPQVIEEPFGTLTPNAGHDTRTTQQSFDERNRLTEAVDPLGGVTRISYDNGDNSIQIVDDATGQPITQTLRYDAVNQLLGTVVTGADGTRLEERFGYSLDRQQTLAQDANGNMTTYEYDDLNRLVRQTDAEGGTSTRSYDADSRVVQETNARGVITEYVYDGLNRPVSQTLDPGGLALTTAVGYDANDNVLTQTDANGVVTCYSYDALDRVTRITADCGGLNAERQIDYDLRGNVIRRVDALGREELRSHDALYRITLFTDPLGQTEVVTYDAADNVTAVTNEGGHTTQYTFDERNRKLSVTDALSGTISYSYDSRDNLIQTTDQLGHVIELRYDGLDRLVESINEEGHSRFFSYDGNGNALLETDELGRPTHYQYDGLDREILRLDPLGGTVQMTYDAVGNVTLVRDEAGETLHMTYDAANRVVATSDPRGQTTTMTYDGVGNQLTLTDPQGQTVTQVFDNLYRQTQLIDPNGDSTVFTYDLVGNLLTLTDAANNTTSMTYDALDRLISETDALGHSTTHDYDVLSNRTQTTDRNGRVRQFSYDDLNRLTQETWVDGNYQASYSYDAASRLVSASDPFASYSFTYDAVGRRLTSDETGSSGVRLGFSYGYDAAGNLVSLLERIDGETTAATQTLYDARDQAVQLTQSGTAVAEKRVDMGYDARGYLTDVNRFADLAGTQNVVSSHFVYDAEEQLTSLTHDPASSDPISYALVYDPADRITDLSHTADGNSTFTYDPFSQLLTANHATQSDESYAYDANGNRSSHIIGPGNRLLDDGTFSYAYDNEGNRIRKTDNSTGDVTEYSYDFHNRLTAVVQKDSDDSVIASVNYVYNVFGERLERQDSTGAVKQFGVQNGRVYLVLDENGAVTNRYLHGPLLDLILADEQVPNGEVLYPLEDHQRTARDILGADGTLRNHRQYDSFGNLVSETDSTVDYLFDFTGRESDPLADLNYHRARYYDPQVGRFINQDPIQFAGGDPNLYRYVNNDPLRFVDPDGLQVNGIDSFFAAIPDNPTSISASDAPASLDNVPFKQGDVLHIDRNNPDNVKLQKLKQQAGLPRTQEQLDKMKKLNEKVARINRNVERRKAAFQRKVDADVLKKKKFGNIRLGAKKFAMKAASKIFGAVDAAIMYNDAMLRVLGVADAHNRFARAARREREREFQRQLNDAAIRQRNAEVRKRNAEIREERRQAFLADQRFEDQFERFVRGNKGLFGAPPGGSTDRAKARAAFELAREKAKDAPDGPAQETADPGNVPPPSKKEGLVGFLNFLAEKHNQPSPFGRRVDSGTGLPVDEADRGDDGRGQRTSGGQEDDCVPPQVK